MFLGFFTILVFCVGITPSSPNAENVTISKPQSVLLDEFDKRIKLIENEIEAKFDELNSKFGKLERQINQKMSTNDDNAKQLMIDIKKLNDVVFEPVDINDIVSIRSKNVSGPHFASGTNFKLKPLLLWPNGAVPTDFDGQFTKGEFDKIRCAIAFFHGFTCIRFVKRKPNHADYLLISKSKSGCFSETVGKIEDGGYQMLNLDQFNDHCWNHGTIVHELMHAVGRFHEHSRMDNKDYIHIHFNNIPQSDHFQYQTPKQMGYNHKDVGYYDYASIMHYPTEMDGKRVISAAFKGDYDQQDRNNEAMGQRNRPSKQDEVKLNMLYNCNGQRTIKMTKVTATTTMPLTTTAAELSDHKKGAPVWTPTNDGVCPDGALPGTKKFKLEAFTDPEQIPHRYPSTTFNTKGWDKMRRVHSKSLCHTICRLDKDCVRSIWAPSSLLDNCVTTSWKAMQKQCVTKRTDPTREMFRHLAVSTWTATCTDIDPCIVKSLMCKCPPGAVKSEVAIMDVELLCGEKWKESEIFSMLCAGVADE